MPTSKWLGDGTYSQLVGRRDLICPGIPRFGPDIRRVNGKLHYCIRRLARVARGERQSQHIIVWVKICTIMICTHFSLANWHTFTSKYILSIIHHTWQKISENMVQVKSSILQISPTLACPAHAMPPALRLHHHSFARSSWARAFDKNRTREGESGEGARRNNAPSIIRQSERTEAGDATPSHTTLRVTGFCPWAVSNKGQ